LQQGGEADRPRKTNRCLLSGALITSSRGASPSRAFGGSCQKSEAGRELQTLARNRLSGMGSLPRLCAITLHPTGVYEHLDGLVRALGRVADLTFEMVQRHGLVESRQCEVFASFVRLDPPIP